MQLPNENGKPSLEVAVVAMEFPCPSETFAGNDIRALIRNGVDVEVHSLRRRIKDSKDYAAAVGADKVTCCPLGDGYEFAFHADYRQAWKWLVETFSEAIARTASPSTTTKSWPL